MKAADVVVMVALSELLIVVALGMGLFVQWWFS